MYKKVYVLKLHYIWKFHKTSAIDWNKNTQYNNFFT